MSELVITDVDAGVLDGLRERAARHGRSPAEEAKTILTDALCSDRASAWAPVDANYERLAASGRSFTDSAEELREDRDR
jgi:plasmid stability protein